LLALLAVNTQAQTTCDSKLIHAHGIGPIRIGHTIPEIRRLCRIVRDTVMRIDEGELGRIVTIALGGTTVRGVVSHDTLWRLDISSPLFATKDSIRVGMPLRDLLRPDVRATAGEGLLMIFPAAHCELSIALHSERDFPTWDLRLAALRTVPPDSRVHEVRIHACDTYRS
jgi:hypothetical protein